jgi:aspartyl-tRNA(Asn)/glutamyl-tRNA(Gln) amidotransferase subunit B
MEYDTIIGLEIHVQTKTNSKMFCTCPTGYFQKEPNSHVCPVCMGLPGALPVPNKRAIELCMLMGLATDCTIANEIYFDRKHYFYPDLPKGYQISQYKNPICSDGSVTLPNGFEVKIERIHQEEDVAKSTHHTSTSESDYSLIDYNKSGVPLIEIVTKPCIRTAKDAKDFATQIRQIARYLNISDADMEKGQMRCEPNISIQEKGRWEEKDGKILPIGDYELNPKVEVKNIGSITAVEKAIEFEVERLTKELGEGRKPIQQTRGWNANKNITEFQRSKETADDYRYMPEPDIPVIEVSNDDIERIKSELVELPHEKITRYMNDWGISQYAAEVISASRKDASYFEKLQTLLFEKLEAKIAAQEAANWLMGTVFALEGDKEIDMNDLSLLIMKFKEGKITKGKAEEMLKDCISNNKDISDELDMFEKSASDNAGNIQDIVKQVLDNNPKAVSDYKGGKEATMGFLVGQVMQATKGASNPNDVKNILIELLK